MHPAFFLAASLAAAPAMAQTVSTTAAPATPAAPSTVLITGNPLGATEVATPGTVLSDEALLLRRASTLGETLDGLPGVSASGFGPNASRPVIRGQDGDRIKVLSNAGASMDASSLSFDHAVPIDPLVIERLEVLRGPAALLYGGGAIGGVVNALDNRIPRSPLDSRWGTLETRLGGAASERALSGLIEGGDGTLAWHADAFARRTSDLRVPRFDRPDGSGGSSPATRVINSASQAQGGALGLSRTWQDGFFGLSADQYRNDYGTVVEDDVTIRMRRNRLALAGEWRALPGAIERLSLQAAATDYQHQEVEGTGEVGTTFRSRGSDLRLEAQHRALDLGSAGRLSGVLGLQAEQNRFSALGEEAFVPSTRTRQAALFVMERLAVSPGLNLSAGLRGEQVQVDSEGDAADATETRFGAATGRRFHPVSAAASAVWTLAPGWQLSSSLASTQRAPTQYELYANGVHAATGAVEVGDPQQALERGRQWDLGLGWQQGGHSARLSLFSARYSHYIALMATGARFTDEAGDSLPVYAFRGVPARLWGGELEGRWQALAGGARQLALTARADLVRGVRDDTGEPLPRLAPWRLTLGAEHQAGPLGLAAEWQHAGRQQRVPADDTATPGWSQLNLRLSWATQLGGHDALWFLKAQNLGDTLATSASAIATVRALSPLPGRNLSAGLRLSL